MAESQQDQTADAAFLGAVLHSLVDPVFVLDDEGRYLGVFGASERSQYDSPDYLVGRRLHDVMDAALADGFLADIRRVIDTGQVHVTEYTLSSLQCDGNPQDGPQGVQWFKGRIAPLDWQGGERRAVAWVVVNISERKRLEAELQRLAHSDELTALRNRRAFLQLAEAALAEAAPGSPAPPLQLALVDLDHFKRVNDRYGHLIGDAVLRHVAVTLVACAGEDAQVARIGGEEFAILFHGLPPAASLERLEVARRQLLDAPLQVGQERITIDFSAGLCGAEITDRHPSDLLRRADQYLYLAKQTGRARTAYPGWVDRRQR